MILDNRISLSSLWFVPKKKIIINKLDNRTSQNLLKKVGSIRGPYYAHFQCLLACIQMHKVN